MWRFCHFNSNWFRDRKGPEMTKKNIDTTTMGGRIQALRLQKGWSSQEELGFRIGVNNKSVISFYEHDTRAVSVPVIQILAKELGTSIDYLVNRTELDEKEDDPDILMAIQLLKSLKTMKGKKAVLEHIQLVSFMDG